MPRSLIHNRRENVVFDGLKGMAGLASMMKDLPRIKARMEEVRASLGDLRVEATSAGGLVSVKASGDLQIVEITCPQDADPAVIRDTVNEALRMAKDEAQRRIADVAAEMGLPVEPGAGGLPGLPGF